MAGDVLGSAETLRAVPPGDIDSREPLPCLPSLGWWGGLRGGGRMATGPPLRERPLPAGAEDGSAVPRGRRGRSQRLLARDYETAEQGGQERGWVLLLAHLRALCPGEKTQPPGS